MISPHSKTAARWSGRKFAEARWGWGIASLRGGPPAVFISALRAFARGENTGSVRIMRQVRAAVPITGRTRRDAMAWGGIGMYPLLYWAGVATLLVWSAYSAYSALVG
jgi:hypothetical protein